MIEKLREVFTIKKIISIVLYIAVIALVGLFQAVAMDFDFSVYKTADFWWRIFYRVILITLTYIAVVNFLYDKLLLSDKVTSARTKYLDVVKMKDTSFKEFLEYYNRKTKKNAWINKIHKKLYKLEDKMVNGARTKSRVKKYEHLKSLITDEYIDEHFDFLDVKYTRVYESDFNSEDCIGSGDKIKTRSNFNGAVAKFSTKKIGLYIMIAVITGSVIYNASVNTGVPFWINLATDLILVLLRTGDGAFQAPVIIDQEYTAVYITKTTIMKEYIDWCVQNNIVESKSHKVISYIENQNKDKEV